jgi:hypothetical protein
VIIPLDEALESADRAGDGGGCALPRSEVAARVISRRRGIDVPVDGRHHLLRRALVLPLLLPGVAVNAWDIAKSLIVTMLIPYPRPVLSIAFAGRRAALGTRDE